MAAARRPLSKLIAATALERVRKAQFVSGGEMAEMTTRSRRARQRKGDSLHDCRSFATEQFSENPWSAMIF